MICLKDSIVPENNFYKFFVIAGKVSNSIFMIRLVNMWLITGIGFHRNQDLCLKRIQSHRKYNIKSRNNSC
jgi:hypothetical protein